MKNKKTIFRSGGRRIAQWTFYVETENGRPDTVVYDALMLENFPERHLGDEPPTYTFKAQLNVKETKLANGLPHNTAKLPECKTMPELWSLCKTAAAGFEILNWKKIIVVGFDYKRGSSDVETRSSGSYRDGRSTEIVFDWAVGEQAGEWFRVYDPDTADAEKTLVRAASQIISYMNTSFSKEDRGALIHVLTYTPELEERLTLLRDKFHQLIDALQEALQPKAIEKFLESIAASGNLLPFQSQPKKD